MVHICKYSAANYRDSASESLLTMYDFMVQACILHIQLKRSNQNDRETCQI